ncbi:hypothetical protein V2J09_004220 [Rumex salicifolius]
MRNKMKTPNAWQLSMQILPMHRHRHQAKRPVWIIVLICLASLFLICGYILPLHSHTACYLFSSRGCKAFTDWIPPLTRREFTDEEVASQVVISEILNMERRSKTPKIAFMFLTPGTLPFEKLWDLFFRGHDGKFTVYVHASQEKPAHQSRHFINSDIRSDKVVWGDVSMIDAERRLLANALRDPDNEQFVLLSDSCVPLHDFDYVYHYLLYTNVSFVDSFIDPGIHGNARYSEHMYPEIEEKHFRKGAQWFTLKRQHALITMADNLYYFKFRDYCRFLYKIAVIIFWQSWGNLCLCKYVDKPGLDGRNCYSDEHYLPTFLSMIDPGGIANWSVTHVDWSEHKWHPKAYRRADVSYELMHNITSIDVSVHVTSEERIEVQERPCLWNGVKRPCYLFARKFYPETLDTMMQIFSNFTNDSASTASDGGLLRSARIGEWKARKEYQGN